MGLDSDTYSYLKWWNVAIRSGIIECELTLSDQSLRRVRLPHTTPIRQTAIYTYKATSDSHIHHHIHIQSSDRELLRFAIKLEVETIVGTRWLIKASFVLKIASSGEGSHRPNLASERFFYHSDMGMYIYIYVYWSQNSTHLVFNFYLFAGWATFVGENPRQPAGAEGGRLRSSSPKFALLLAFLCLYIYVWCTHTVCMGMCVRGSSPLRSVFFSFSQMQIERMQRYV